MIDAQTKLCITVGDTTYTASLVKNEAVDNLCEILADGPLTIAMTDNGGFEKVGDLPCPVRHYDVRQTAVSGDIMLYLGRTVCIFYGSNTWAYTKLGHLDGMSASEIRSSLSGSRVEVVLSLPDAHGR